MVPGFLCKINPTGRKVFMLQYRTNAGERRKPALGQYGELTVDQARTMAQEWLAEVRKGGDPSATKNAARKAPTMKEFCHTFMEDYSKQRNKPSTQRGYQGVIDRCIIPIMGRMCSGLMNPDTHLGENGRCREVSDEQATSFVYPRVQARGGSSGTGPGL